MEAPINFSAAVGTTAFPPLARDHAGNTEPSSAGPINQAQLSVFEQPWWIAIAKGSSQFHEALVEKNGVVVGKLPYVVTRDPKGFRNGRVPDWSHLGGPVLDPTLSRNEKADVLRELIGQLPSRTSFIFERSALSPDADLIRETFADAGFEHGVRRTYTQRPDQLGLFFPDATDELGLHRKIAKTSKKGMADGSVVESEKLDDAERKRRDNMNRTRSQIRSAQTRLDVISLTPQEFVKLYEDNLRAEGKKPWHPLETAESLMEAGIARGQVRIFAASNKQQEASGNGRRIDAAIACSNDHERSYLWMITLMKEVPGDKEASPDPGAMKLLIAHAIRDAHKRGLVFDADGVGVGATETLYRDRMYIPNVEERDVFTRLTPLARFVEKSVRPFAAKLLHEHIPHIRRVVMDYAHHILPEKKPLRSEGIPGPEAAAGNPEP